MLDDVSVGEREVIELDLFEGLIRVGAGVRIDCEHLALLLAQKIDRFVAHLHAITLFCIIVVVDISRFEEHETVVFLVLHFLGPVEFHTVHHVSPLVAIFVAADVLPHAVLAYHRHIVGGGKGTDGRGRER